MEINIFNLRELCTPQNIKITIHAAKRLEQRGILLKDVISCIQTGEIIEHYPNDYPYPSCLVSGLDINQNYLHIVTGIQKNTLFLITAYFPSADKWSPDFKIRKEN